jgi:hypothetical protein
MDLTIQNFENNLGKLDENMQEKVIDLIEQNPQEVLEGLANAFGVSLVTEEGVTTGPDTFGEETDRVPSDEEDPPFAADPRQTAEDPPFAADPRQTAEDSPRKYSAVADPIGDPGTFEEMAAKRPPEPSMYGVGKPEEGMDSPYPVKVGTLGDDTVSGVGPPLIPMKKQMQKLQLGEAVERSDQSTEIVPSQEELLLGMSQPAEGEEAVAEGEETTGEIAVEGADTSGVADDIPIKSSEGAFVLNAEAVTFAGRMDIRKMIEEAAESLERQGKRVNIGNIKDPSAQTTGTEDVLISNGEVIISKAMAEEIGGDRLTKINERGKAATEQKIQEQQAQEQQGTPQKTIPVRAT